MEWSLDGAQLSGKEAAKGSEHGMGAAIVRLQGFGCSDDRSCRESMKRCRESTRRLSRLPMSEQEDVAWLMSLLDGLSMPKSSAGTSEEVKITSELSNVKFRECEVNEEDCS